MGIHGRPRRFLSADDRTFRSDADSTPTPTATPTHGYPNAGAHACADCRTDAGRAAKDGGGPEVILIQSDAGPQPRSQPGPWCSDARVRLRGGGGLK
jgi:hypothetical protein